MKFHFIFYRYSTVSIEYLFVFFTTFQCSDLILVQISRDRDTFGNLGRRGRSLKNTFVLLRV